MSLDELIVVYLCSNPDEKRFVRYNSNAVAKICSALLIIRFKNVVLDTIIAKITEYNYIELIYHTDIYSVIQEYYEH